MINSEKLSLFRSGNTTSIGLSDVKMNKLESIDGTIFNNILIPGDSPSQRPTWPWNDSDRSKESSQSNDVRTGWINDATNVSKEGTDTTKDTATDYDNIDPRNL